MPRAVTSANIKRGKDYDESTFQKAIKLLHQRSHQKRSKRLRLAKIASLCNVRSVSIIKKWNMLYIHQRHPSPVRGRPGKLTLLQQRVLCGEVIMKHVLHEDTTTRSVVATAKALFGIDLDRRYVSKVFKCFHFTPGSAQAIALETLTREKTQQAVQFLTQHRNRNIPASKLFCLDKKGLHLGKIKAKHWRPTGW
jgi:transposase